MKKGLSSARMDDMAARAGLSKGAIYLCFESKDTVFEGSRDRTAERKRCGKDIACVRKGLDLA